MYYRIYMILPAIALVRLVIIIILITVLSAKSHAEEPSKDTLVIWDLETCIRYARQHNIALKRKQLEQRASEQALLLSRAAKMPDLYASGTRFVDHSNTAVSGESGWNGSGDFGLSSSWTLFRGGYLSSDIRQKGLQLASANLAVIQQDNNITLQIIQQYLNALLDKESIVYARSLVGTSAAQVDQARQKLVAGSIARKDLMQLESQLANDQYLLINSENAERQDLISLKQLLQLPTMTDLDIVAVDLSQIQAKPDNMLFVQQQALSNRPEIRNATIGIAVADAGLAKARAGYLPTLTLAGYAGSRYFGSSTSTPRQLGDNFSQQINLSMSVPIFTRKLNAVNVSEAKIGIEQAKLNLTDARTALSLAIERVYNNLINAQNQLKGAAASLNYNSETYRVAVEQLKTGLINMVEFLQQKALYTQAQQQFLQAKYTTALTYRIYDFYKGYRQ